MTVLTELEEGELEEVFSWVDGIELSRPKKNLTRDFADGVLVAEVSVLFRWFILIFRKWWSSITTIGRAR